MAVQGHAGVDHTSNCMKVVFRADASLRIGTGHVMRCLTLADALAERGAICHFISREHAGSLIELIQVRGYQVHPVPLALVEDINSNGCNQDKPLDGLAHSRWLGATQAQDVQACSSILKELKPDWLIVDHYALDARWEQALAQHYGKLMVIDDLADRQHACDLLLDQTFGRDAAVYRPLVPSDCHLLCGSSYALLRPEFASLRSYSLQRRAQPSLRELLITMGGVDKDNATGQVLQMLRTCPLPAASRITVVMGATAPWLNEVRVLARDMPWPTRVLVGVSDMAQLMADSDLAIGAAGTTSWERCCLGLPTIMLVLADNQRKIAEALSEVGAAHFFDTRSLKHQRPIVCKYFEALSLSAMSCAAAGVTDGSGAARVAETLTKRIEDENQLAV
jgi:UDP-2,4-diacetamido-2,4,6-trideoxy-beta-L-altropyranose hydrolase